MITPVWKDSDVLSFISWFLEKLPESKPIQFTDDVVLDLLNWHIKNMGLGESNYVKDTKVIDEFFTQKFQPQFDMHQVLITEIEKKLSELENLFWYNQNNFRGKPNYQKQSLRAAIKIFMSVALDKMYVMQDNDDLPHEDRLNMAKSFGEEVRKLIKTFTDTETQDLQ